MANRGTAIVGTNLGILIVKDNFDLRKYALPGGRFDKKDKDFLDTAIRELWEETGLTGDRYNSVFVGNVFNNKILHSVYLIKVNGKLVMTNDYKFKTTSPEVINGGFFNLKLLNKSNRKKYQSHVYACVGLYKYWCKTNDWKKYFSGGQKKGNTFRF